jgi:hypothetical protein
VTISKLRSSVSTLGNPEGGKPPSSDAMNTAVNRASKSWAEASSTPAHPTRSNVVSVATDDDHCDNQFIEQQSQRYRRTKRKMNNSFTVEKTDEQQQSRTAITRQLRRGPTVYGRSSDGNAGIAAAKKLVKKAVYCIDNIDISCKLKILYNTLKNKRSLWCLVLKLNHDIGVRRLLWMTVKLFDYALITIIMTNC